MGAGEGVDAGAASGARRGESVSTDSTWEQGSPGVGSTVRMEVEIGGTHLGSMCDEAGAGAFLVAFRPGGRKPDVVPGSGTEMLRLRGSVIPTLTGDLPRLVTS